MLGQDLVDVLRAKHDILALDHAACDISDEAAVRRIFGEWRPALVVNCAAYADVDGCERDPARAFAVNSRGAGNVARAAEQVGGRVFYISTDYVFDGQKREPYREEDPTAPINLYGESKLEGERMTLGSDGARARHLVIRTSWLYGIHRPNFIEKTLADAQSQPKIVAVADQISCPTWTLQLAQKIAELAATSASGLVHVVNSGQCSRCEMAQAIVEKQPRCIPVEPTYWAKLNRPARRPAYSVLGGRRIEQWGLAPLPHWRGALEEYIRVRQAIPSVAGRNL